MATNFERIKNMTVDEISELFIDDAFFCTILKSKDEIKQWLQNKPSRIIKLSKSEE